MLPSSELPKIQEVIHSGLTATRQKVKRLNALNLVLTLVSMLAGGLATLIAAFAAFLGGAVLQGGGTVPWQVICAFVAVFSFVSTAAGGLSQQLAITEKLSHSRIYAGRLASLEASLSLGSQPPDEVIKEYSRLQSEFSAMLG